MAYDVYTFSGIILDVWNHKEWDKKFIIFSKENGIMTVVAIGAQRPASKMRGHIIRFCNLSIDVVHGKTGYRLIRVQTNNNSFLIHKKESYFVLIKTARLINDLLPSGAPHRQVFLVFNKLNLFLENNIITKESENKLFYETALLIFSALGYRRGTLLDFESINNKDFDLEKNENDLFFEYQSILNENGLVNMI